MGFKVKGRLKGGETYLKHDENFGGKVLEGGRFGVNGQKFGGKIGGTKSDRKGGNMFLWLL